MMKYYFPIQPISYIIESTVISRNRNYPLWHLQDVLLPLFNKNYTYDSLRETIRSANHIWCAYEYDKCIGCSLITDIGNNRGLYMLLFGIRQSAQGRGIGKRLLDDIILWSTLHGYRYIYLHTELDNKKAIQMYERAGFRRDFYLPDGIENLPQMGSDAMPMVLYLI